MKCSKHKSTKLYTCLNTKYEITSLNYFSIACLHILLNGTDQFIANIFLLRGELHQVLRDIGLMLPDLLHVILPIIEYKKNDESSPMVFFLNGKENNSWKKNKITPNNLMKYIALIGALWVVGNNL